MSQLPTISNAAAVAGCNAVVDLLDAGTPPGLLKIYKNDGSPTVPVDADAGLGGATLLVTLTLGNPAFGAAADDTGKATATAAAITNGNPVANGTAAFFRATNAAGTCVIQGTVGTANADLILDDIVIAVGTPVSISSWTFSVPEHA